LVEQALNVSTHAPTIIREIKIFFIIL